MHILSHFFATLFPDKCVGCQERGILLCEKCQKNIAPATNPMHGWITSVFAYNDFRVKRLIWLLKYKNTRHVASIFAPFLTASLIEFLGEEALFHGARKIVLVPIPLSKKRMAKRGYNQAELLAKGIFENSVLKNISLNTKLLQKIVETKPQADIKNRGRRLENLGDCFAVNENMTANGEVVILIDDVTTTGATVTAARKVLRAAGFRTIYALTVAH
jgi:ComF family protein